GSGGIAPDLIHGGVAKNERDTVDANSSIPHDENSRDIVKAHIGINPNAHLKSSKPIKDCRGFDGQIKRDGCPDLMGRNRCISLSLDASHWRLQEVFTGTSSKRYATYSTRDRP